MQLLTEKIRQCRSMCIRILCDLSTTTVLLLKLDTTANFPLDVWAHTWTFQISSYSSWSQFHNLACAGPLKQLSNDCLLISLKIWGTKPKILLKFISTPTQNFKHLQNNISDYRIVLLYNAFYFFANNDFQLWKLDAPELIHPYQTRTENFTAAH